MDGSQRRQACSGTADATEADRRAAVHLAPAATVDFAPYPAADPPVCTIAHTLEDLLLRGCSNLAEGTRSCYRQKAGHLLRLMGTIPLAVLHLDQVQDYIDARLAEGAARETVHRELVVLRKALKLAVRRGHTGPNVDQVMPEFTRHYVPRKRWLSPEQVDALHAQLEPKRRLWLITAVYLGPRLGELERLDWNDFNFEAGTVHVRGTKGKRDKADRVLPLHPRILAGLGTTRRLRGPFLAPWGSIRRDLALACQRAGIPRVSANDLRRTFASWLLQAGVSNFVVSQMMGHSTTTMVDRIYGRLTLTTLREAINKMP